MLHQRVICFGGKRKVGFRFYTKCFTFGLYVLLGFLMLPRRGGAMHDFEFGVGNT